MAAQQALFVYVLKLDCGKYYVGRTEDIDRRFEQHLDGLGSEWTRRYSPIEIHDLDQSDDPFAETAATIKMMATFGIENVRGGPFCRLELSAAEIEVIKSMISAAYDTCFKCGSSGHFAADCSAPSLVEQYPSLTRTVSFKKESYYSPKLGLNISEARFKGPDFGLTQTYSAIRIYGPQPDVAVSYEEYLKLVATLWNAPLTDVLKGVKFKVPIEMIDNTIEFRLRVSKCVRQLLVDLGITKGDTNVVKTSSQYTSRTAQMFDEIRQFVKMHEDDEHQVVVVEVVYKQKPILSEIVIKR